MSEMLVDGDASGVAAILDEPLSFWGGYDSVTGTIVDRSHPQRGESLAGKVVVMAHGRGSSSSSAVIAEALRLGTGPAAFVLSEPDSIIVTGVLVARLLYEVECPVVVAEIDGPGRWRVSSEGLQRLD